MSYTETANTIKQMLVEQDITIERKDGNHLMFRIRPISAREFAKVTKGKSQSGMQDDIGEGFVTMERIVMDCVINPKIVTGDPASVPADQLSIESVPMDLLNKVFDKILRISGLTADEEEESKN